MKRFQKVSKKVLDTLSSTKSKILFGSTAAIMSTQSFALTTADFDVTGASGDIGLAAVAVVTLGVLIMGFRGVKSMIN